MKNRLLPGQRSCFLSSKRLAGNYLNGPPLLTFSYPSRRPQSSTSQLFFNSTIVQLSTIADCAIFAIELSAGQQPPRARSGPPRSRRNGGASGAPSCWPTSRRGGTRATTSTTSMSGARPSAAFASPSGRRRSTSTSKGKVASGSCTPTPRRTRRRRSTSTAGGTTSNCSSTT